MGNDKNKIDAVIDEVLESKRLKEGVQIAKKGIAISFGIGLVIFIIIIIGVALGMVR